MVAVDAASVIHGWARYHQAPDALQEARSLVESLFLADSFKSVENSFAIDEYAQILQLEYEHTGSDETREKCAIAYAEAMEGIAGRPLISTLCGRRAAQFSIRVGDTDKALRYMNETIYRLTKSCHRWLHNQDQLQMLANCAGMPSDGAAIALSVSRETGGGTMSALRLLELGRSVILGTSISYRSEAKLLSEASSEISREWYGLCIEAEFLFSEKKDNKSITRRERVTQGLEQVCRKIRDISGYESFFPSLPLGSLIVHQLRSISPELYYQYTELHREYVSFPKQEKPGLRSQKRREFSDIFDELLSKIRKLPGLGNFLQPPNETELKDMARHGCIVIVNSSQLMSRSDAIIIQSSQVTTCILPRVSPNEVAVYMRKCKETSTGWKLRNYGKKNRDMCEVLRWLWEAIVFPIFQDVGFKPMCANARKPRVHWIGTGMLSRAPFHAAGAFTSDGDPSAHTMCYVTSSYASTLQALRYSREDAYRENYRPKDKRMSIISMPHAVGAAALPAVQDEVQSLQSLSRSTTNVTTLDSPTPEQVIAELPHTNIAHFACHAVSDAKNLVNSYLLLRKPNNEVGSDHLDVSQISVCRAPAAELAFLSACSVAENAVDSLADEAVHIANGFQLAGFKNVIATTWPVRDDCCKEVARDFYGAYLGHRDAAGLSPPEALHQAVEKLRAAQPDKPLAWAPFVHIGA